MKFDFKFVSRVVQEAARGDVPLVRVAPTPAIGRLQVLKLLAGSDHALTVAAICELLLGRTDHVASHRVSALIAREVARGTVCNTGRLQERHITDKGRVEAAAAQQSGEAAHCGHGITQRGIVLEILRQPGITRQALLAAVVDDPSPSAAASMATTLWILHDKRLVASLDTQSKGLTLTDAGRQAAARWGAENALAHAVLDPQSTDFALRAAGEQLEIRWTRSGRATAMACTYAPAQALSLVHKAGLRLAPRGSGESSKGAAHAPARARHIAIEEAAV